MNVEIGAEAAQFPEKEYKNGIAVAVQLPSADYSQCHSDIFLVIARDIFLSEALARQSLYNQAKHPLSVLIH
jgi:hypothetical protein